MRMEKLHIYGYGKLENVEMDPSMLTVLYGENEAGKSTIRSFMKSILFGFPTRGQRRYEPKEGGKYGGAMTVQTEKYGRLKIERLPKTAAGEVTVYFEDGKTGGEEILHDILTGMNESLFESVFHLICTVFKTFISLVKRTSAIIYFQQAQSEVMRYCSSIKSWRKKWISVLSRAGVSRN